MVNEPMVVLALGMIVAGVMDILLVWWCSRRPDSMMAWAYAEGFKQWMLLGSVVAAVTVNSILVIEGSVYLALLLQAVLMWYVVRIPAKQRMVDTVRRYRDTFMV